MKHLVVALLLAPGTLAAQDFSLAPYAAQNRSLPGSPTIYGASLTAYRGIFGVRGGGAVGQAAAGDGAGRATAWTADADLVVDVGRLPAVGPLLAGFLPTGFVGVGAQGVAPPAAPAEYAPLWSYGAGVSRTLLGGLALETEARRRTPVQLDGRAIPAGFARGWEYRLGLAFRFGGTASGRGAARAPVPVRDPTRPSSGAGRPRSAPPSASAARVLATADDYLGTPYLYGGTTPRGFDCSGFVQYVFRRHGVTLPRTSRQQATAGERAAASVGALRAGDLMLFASRGSRIDHVAIYAGNGRIIHSTSSGGGVRFDNLSSERGRWFVAHHVASRRVLQNGQSLVRAFEREAPLAASELDPPDLAPRPRR